MEGTRERNLVSTTSLGGQPCQCVPFDSSWKKPTRTVPKCIYFDLGAAGGNSFQLFLEGKFGSLQSCGTSENKGDYEAYLLEANPYFDSALQKLEADDPKHVHAMNSTAVYTCEARTSFFVDNVTVEHNFWGSSLDGKQHSAADWSEDKEAPEPANGAMAGEKITVPTVNLMRLLYENTISVDQVTVKMDVEGAEWDIVPCLASSPAAALVDQLFMEQHPIDWQLGTTTRTEMSEAKAKLQQVGIKIPEYYSPTL